MTQFDRFRFVGLLCGVFAVAAPGHVRAQDTPASRGGDHIIAVVNQELVTAGELERRIEALRRADTRGGQARPDDLALRTQALEDLVQERVVVTYARDAGWRVDEADLDRAVQSVATQNQLTIPQLAERLKVDGLDMPRFRASLRDQLLVERTREREVAARIQVSEGEIDAHLAERNANSSADPELNLAQILVEVPEGADAATIASRRARVDAALNRIKAGEAFEAVAKEVSEDANRERGGEIGSRPASRLPDLFVGATRDLAVGQVTPSAIRSGAGFHLLKVLTRESAGVQRVTETRARHILLRTSEQASPQVAARRLQQLREQIASGARRFDDVAREVSEDGSAPEGGDLGWFRPGVMVPEFEEPMNALDIGGVSQPVRSRFGMHLIQVVDRRQVSIEQKELRAQAANELRERKFQQAFEEWMRELRARAYVELRDGAGR